MQALKHPRDVSMNLVNAQQAPRARLSGRLQSLAAAVEEDSPRPLGGRASPALRMIVERELEIEAFSR